MTIQGQQVVRRRAPGAFAVAISTLSIAAHKSASAQTFDVVVRASRGADALEWQTDYACSLLGSGWTVTSGLSWSFAVAEDRSTFTYRLHLVAGAVVNTQIPFTVTDKRTQAKYAYSIAFATVEDGGKGDKGEQGIAGCILRTSEWSVGATYHNDEGLASGTRYLDVAIVTAADGTFAAYKCRRTHTATESNAPTSGTDTAEWENFDELAPVYTPLLLARNAVVRFGQTNRMLIMNSEQKIQACLQGTDDEENGYTFWSGGETPETARFRVRYDGRIEAVDGLFSGFIYSRELVLTEDNLSEYTEEDPYGGMTLSLKLTGQRIRMKLSTPYGIYIPSIYPEITTYTEEYKELCRSYVGAKLMIYVDSGAAVMTGNIRKEENGTASSHSIEAGCFCILTCCLTATDGKEDIYWLIRKGKQNGK